VYLQKDKYSSWKNFQWRGLLKIKFLSREIAKRRKILRALHWWRWRGRCLQVVKARMRQDSAVDY